MAMCADLVPTEDQSTIAKWFAVYVRTIDDFSGMYFTYFMKHKNEVNEKFISLKEKYENLLGVN